MGFWSDLMDLGEQRIKAEAAKRSQQSGTSAHIAAQNQVRDEFGQILNTYHMGSITNATAQQQISRANQGFAAFCRNLGYPRALQGASDVDILAQKILADLRTERITGATGSLTGTTANVLTGGAAGPLSTTTVLLMAGAAYMLYKRKVF